MSQATNSVVAFWGAIVCVFVAPDLWMKWVFFGVVVLNLISNFMSRLEARR